MIVTKNNSKKPVTCHSPVPINKGFDGWLAGIVIMRMQKEFQIWFFLILNYLIFAVR